MTRQRLARILLAVALGLLVGVAVDIGRTGGLAAWLATRGPALNYLTPYIAQGERVVVEGRSTYLDCRGTGSPTVILEAGAGGGAGSWAPVLEPIARVTRTCGYDRPGLGSSDSRGVRTLEAAAADLRALLEAAGEPPPYVVVGHSLGGAYARVFAAVHRDEVPAIVLLDSFDPDLEAAHIHPMLGGLRPEYEDRLDGLRDYVASSDQLDWPASEAELAASDIRGLRVAVLVARRGEPRLDAATNSDIEAAWEAAYRELSPGHVTYDYADGSGHLIPYDRPDLVIALVERIVAEVRAGGPGR
jgi:pimeloyl-ACP methyl ester carboxylesterase